MTLPKRKPTRLKEYDYSSNGYYFVTICTHKRKKILSKIIVGQGLAPAVMQLTQYGKIAETELMRLETAYSCVKIDKYVIMPNHIHAIIVISNDAAGASPSPTNIRYNRSIKIVYCTSIWRKTLATLILRPHHP